MTIDARRERKVISVVFADLVGFTARSESLDPEDVEAFLHPYHLLLRAELEAFGGTVEKFIGDAVVAIFGAPVAHEDDAERAVRAALAIRDAVIERGDLEVRIAVNTGEAIVWVDVRADSGEGMATGDVLNTASRLQAAAPVNGVLVGEATWRATRDVIEYEPSEPVVAKGKPEPVPVWVATGARSRLGPDVRQVSDVPLVGRARERSILLDTLARVESEEAPQLVTLVGVPGIGKSRMVYELFAEVDAQPELRRWRAGRCLPYGKGVSFWALAEIVKAEAGIYDSDSSREAAGKLAAAVRAVVPADQAEWVTGWLAPIAGLEAPTVLQGERRSEAFAAWRRFLEGMAERHTLVLVFEDLHWADDGLLDFLEHLVEWATGVPILVLCTTRPELLERRPRWAGGLLNALTLALSPLSDAEVARLLALVLDEATLAPETEALLLERVSGNPLYAEQFARLFRERGTVDGLLLPETVHGLIAARLDALTPAEKSLLQDAAVMGKVFWTGCLLGGATSGDLLQGLVRKEFIRRERRSSVTGEDEFAFRHVLVRDVAYSQIPRADRATRHLRAADWIESLGRPEDHAELLAYHLGAAIGPSPSPQLADRARAALRDAGLRAIALYAYDAAVRYVEQALALTPDDGPERADLLVRRARAENLLTGRAEERLAEAAAALVAVGDVERAAEAHTWRSRAHWRAGDLAQARAAVDDALELVGGGAPTRAKAGVLTERARLLALSGQGGAREAAEAAVALTTELGFDDLRGNALVTLGTLLGLADGEAFLREGIEIGATTGDRLGLFRGWNNLSTLLEDEGRLAESDHALAQAEDAARRFNSRSEVLWTLAGACYQSVRNGDWDDALRRYGEVLAAMAEDRGNYQETNMLVERAWVLACRGETEAAAEDLDRAGAKLDRMAEPQLVLPGYAVGMATLLVLGDVSAARERLARLLDVKAQLTTWRFGGPSHVVDAAIRLGHGAELLASHVAAVETRWLVAGKAFVEGSFETAIQVYEAMPSPLDASIVRLAHAEALVAGGDPDAAAAALAPAVEFFRRAGASRLLERAARIS